jgi:glycosyltransferase involved in cell wall biosynthesis
MEVLFSAMKQLKESNVKVILILTVNCALDTNKKYLGNYDKETRRLAHLVKVLEIEDVVKFIGWQKPEKLPKLYNFCDIFVFPSLCESFGFSMLEAMAASLPIIAAETPINREILQNAALYYNPWSSQELAKTIIFLAGDDKIKSDLKNNAKKRTQQYDWSWKRNAKEIVKILKDNVHSK